MKNLRLFIFVTLFIGCSLEKVEDEIKTVVVLPTFETHFVAQANKTVSVESVVEAIDGGYIISGQMYDANFFGNIFIIKRSITGDHVQIVTSFGNNFGEIIGGKLIRVTDGYFIVGSEGGGGSSQIFAAKLRTDLTLAWPKSYGIIGRDEKGGDLILNSRGELIVAGNNGTFTTSFPLLLRINADNGNLIDSATITNSGFGRYFPVSMIRNGSAIGIMGYNFGISIPFPFFMKINENIKPLIAYKSLEDVGGGSGVLVQVTTNGFVIIDGTVTQTLRRSYVSSIDSNGVKIGKFDQFPLLAESGFLGGAKHTNGKYIAVGWGGQTLGGVYFGEAALLTSSLAMEQLYESKQATKTIEFTAANSTSDGGYILAGSYDNGKEIILVKLNSQFKL